jgi:hypothetical protein
MSSLEEVQAKLAKLQADLPRRSLEDIQARLANLQIDVAEIQADLEALKLPVLPPTLEQDEERLQRYLALKPILVRSGDLLRNHPSIKAAEGWLGKRPELDPLALNVECDKYVLRGCVYNVPLPELYMRWFCDTRQLEIYPAATHYVLAGRWADVLMEFVQRLGVRMPHVALPAEKLDELRKDAGRHDEPARRHVLKIVEEGSKILGEKFYL